MAAVAFLNCDDMPEAKVWGAGRVKKLRVKTVGLPVVAEIGNEDSEEDEQPQSSWSCCECTFLNHASLTRCEMCNSERSKDAAMSATAPQLADGHKALEIGSSPCHDWPALPEAWVPCEGASSWVDCDATSVASWVDCDAASVTSWLDVGDNELSDNEEAGFVHVDASGSPVPVPKPAATPLWSAIVGSKDVGSKDGRASLPTAEVAVPPPCSRKPPVRKCAKALEQEGRDVDLDELDIRRMVGTRRHRNRLRECNPRRIR